VRIAPFVAVPTLLLCVGISFLGIFFARSLDNAFQALLMLISMALVFFASHPLGHFFWAGAYGVQTRYFFLGRSDFRRLPSKLASLAGLMPTIGTKLNKDLRELPPRRRGYIFGAGVIVSNTLVGIEFAWVFVTGFGSLAVLVGAVFFAGTVASELLFSTKVGDLAKMTRELRKTENARPTVRPKSHRCPP
jgi:hypothetical protein